MDTTDLKGQIIIIFFVLHSKICLILIVNLLIKLKCKKWSWLVIAVAFVIEFRFAAVMFIVHLVSSDPIPEFHRTILSQDFP